MSTAVITRERVDAVWAALWAREYDSYALTEVLAEAALEELAAGESIEDAIGYAERRYGVRPRGTWCSECLDGGTGSDWDPARCELCNGWLEVA